MFKLVRSLPGIESFDLVPVFDYDQEGERFAYLIPSQEDVEALHRELECAIEKTEDATEKAFYEQWKRVSSFWLTSVAVKDSDHLDHADHSCMVPWYSSYVDAKGRVYPCCYLTNSSHIMGNIYESSFREVWTGEAYQDFRRRLITERRKLDGCRTCPRNDDKRLAQLAHLKPILPRVRQEAEKTPVGA